MSEFKCNLPECRVQIMGKALVSNCGHLFCGQHAYRECMLCNRSAQYIDIDVSPEAVARKKALIMIGFSPQDIIDASRSALTFWSNQKQLELNLLKHTYQQREKKYNEKLKQYQGTVFQAQQAVQELKQRLNTSEKSRCELESRVQQFRLSYTTPNLFEAGMQKSRGGSIFDAQTNHKNNYATLFDSGHLSQFTPMTPHPFSNS